MCVHMHTSTQVCPFSSVSNGPPSLTFSLGSSSCWEHCHSTPCSFLGPLGGRRGKKTSEEGHRPPFGVSVPVWGPCAHLPRAGDAMEVIHGPWSHAEGLAARHCHPEPTQFSSLSSGPEPGATPKCLLDFLRAPGSAPSLLSLTVYCLSPSWFSLCRGAVGSVTPTTVESTPSAG